MFPNVFLKTFWRLELRPQVFVAMRFGKDYLARFTDIIAPAIRSIERYGARLEPFRVDFSCLGDSVLAKAMDGIAHSELFLADVSAMGKDAEDKPNRNGNVMYEVGLALACRQPAEVLLIRDDKDEFLFDVSTIPHMEIDFSTKEGAIDSLRNALIARLDERDYTNDARVHLAIAKLGSDERLALTWGVGNRSDDILEVAIPSLSKEDSGYLLPATNTRIDILKRATPRLLDLQLIILAGKYETGEGAYRVTPLGIAVAQLLKSGLPEIKHSKTFMQVEKLRHERVESQLRQFR